METSKECPKKGGPKHVGLGTKQEKKKGKTEDEIGERIYTSKWNGRNYDSGTERIGKHGRQDAENGVSCNKAAVYTGCFTTLGHNGRR